jgi:20S proteasome subunit beta 2
LIQQHNNYIDEVTHSGDYSEIIGRSHEYDNDDEDDIPSSYGFNNVLNHNHQSLSSSGGGDQWQSPLEGYSPLPSLSLGLSQQSQSFLSTEEANLSDGLSQWSHSHIIDIHASSSTQQQHSKLLRTRTTGTTIVALIAAGDTNSNSTVLILAADTRATDGSTVSDNRCSKLHELANNVWAAGAGTSADVEALVRRTKYKFWKLGRTYMYGCGGIGNTIVNDNSDNYMDKMDNNKNNVGNKKEDENDTTCRIVSPSLTHDMIDNNTPLNYNDDDGSKLIPPPASVTAVLHYLRSQLRKSNGNLGVNLLVGGYDPLTSRALLAAIHPHGSIDIVSYSALGSGGLAAMGVLESRYPTRRSRRRRQQQQRKQDSTANADMSSSSSCMMTVAEGIQLAVDAVRAGIDNDLGSGSQVDVCVIGPGGVFYRRAVAREEELQWTSDNVNDDVVDGASISNSSAVLESSWKTAREVGQGSSSGVNGFGNIPFAIQSKKVVIGGRFSSSFDVDNNVKYKQGRSWLDEVIHMRTKK